VSRITYGDCIGCEQPIRPPFLSFTVHMNNAPDGNSITSWEDVDVCGDCAAKLTAADLHRLVSEGDE
jgi:hypothetical protein